MRHQHKKIIDDIDLPRAGSWLMYTAGALAIFTVGMKFGQRRSHIFPGMALDFLRMMLTRR
jgi:hypothetical protein